jgi:DNA mismatch endonuclease (patch repair protein)
LDIWSEEKRSEVMAAIRSSGTKPEVELHRIVKAALPRWSVVQHAVSVPGRPDVYVPSLGLAIFVDGCFWHCCPKHGKTPKSRADYWVPKLAANVARDRRITSQLRRHGFGVWRVWEHDLTGPRRAITESRITARLKGRVAR